MKLELIDTQHELNAITDYIKTTWDGFEDIEPSFFTKIWDNCNNLLTNHFSPYGFMDVVKNLGEWKDKPNIFINDSINSTEVGLELYFAQSKLTNLVREKWDYSSSVSNILADIKNEFPESTKARPKGWEKFADDYEDYAGMAELDVDALKKLFTGVNSKGGGSSSFEVRTSLPHVMYDDQCQSRKPLEVLVGAMLGHAYFVAEKNNGNKMLQEWQNLEKELNQPGVTTVNFQFEEKLNRALVNIIKDGDVYPPTLSLLKLDKKKNYKM